MSATGPGHSHFGAGVQDLSCSAGEVADAIKLATTMTTIANRITPETLLTTQALNAVTIPQSFCFPPQTSMATGITTNQQQAPGTPSPLNVTLGFPMSVSPGGVGHPFMQPFSVGQICTSVGGGIGIPLNQAILAVPNPGQGPFISGPFNQFQPIIMGGQQQVMANAVIGAAQNNGMPNVATLGGQTNSFTFNAMSVPSVVPKEQIIENVTESSNDSEGGFSTDNSKQEFGDLADVESILNIANMEETALSNDIEMPMDDVQTDDAGLNTVEPVCNPVSAETDSAAKETDNTPMAEEKKDDNIEELAEDLFQDDSSICKEYEPITEEKPACESETEATVLPVLHESPNGQGVVGEKGEAHDDKNRFSMIDTADYNEDGIPVEYDQPEFVWEEYLQETGASAVPPTAFKHVECSLQSGFMKGMKMEVPNKNSTDTYWIAAVIMTCGPLLRLRYDGYEEDGSADFWCDLMTSEMHPIGWCTENGRTLQPPEAIKDKFSDWKEFLVSTLTGARTAPTYLLDKTTGSTPIDQLKQDMKLEIQDTEYPTHIWVVQIIENVGGRLYLRYEGIESGIHDFWLFYLNYRLHPIGWTKEKGYKYKPPKVIEAEFASRSPHKVQLILDAVIKEAREQTLPLDIFKDQIDIPTHTFKKGWKLEAINPNSRNQICPATVVEVLNNRYFLVAIDSLLEKDKNNRIKFCCHGNSRTIFPLQWCQYKGLKLTPPSGWHKPDFNWLEYLSHCNAKPAPETAFNMEVLPHEFERGMKLEAVNPDNHNQICAATITKIVDNLMWIHLDNSMKIVASHIEDIESNNLFPIGWCESNGYQLKPPRKMGLKRPMHKRVAVVQPEMADGNWNEDFTGDTYAQIKNGESGGSGWCPKIYFNHKCFSGPYLSKGRIAELPKCVGPGPINLVMKEVLSMLINVAYKSCRVLREIQMEGKPNPSMHQQNLKAKYKGKSYRAVVEICKSTCQLDEFCRQVCIKLECCPNLISPHFVNGNCPETCSQLTKTKYTYYYGKKKRKIGRPPGGHSNLENGPKKPGKRKKRKKINLVHKKSRSSIDDSLDYLDDDKDSVASDTHTIDSTSTSGSKDKDSDLKPSHSMRLKRKYTHHLPPPSDIRTRGAKLPKYSFERRTHKKIMLGSYSHAHSHAKSHSHMHSRSRPHGHTHTHSHAHGTPGMKSKSSMKSHREHSHHRKEGILKLDKNPLKWTLMDVVEFIKTTDCAHLARLFKEQEIDGQALLLLTLPTVQEHLELKLGPAIKLCHHIERVKIAFYESFAK